MPVSSTVLADWVRARRKQAGWSQSELASKARVSRDVVKRIEASADVRWTTAAQVIAALEATADETQRLFAATRYRSA